MKVLLYFEAKKLIAVSGIGRALAHQKQALSLNDVAYTTDVKCDDYSLLHINTVGPNSQFVINRAKKAGKAIVYHAHSTEEDFRNSFVLSNQIAPLFKKHLIKLYSQADLVITPTPYAKQLLLY